MRQPKVLFFVGADFYFCSHRLLLARGLQRAGYQVVVLTHVIEDGDRIRREGFKLIESSLRRGGLNPFQDLRSLVQTVGTYRAERPDLAHHVGIKPILYGSIASAITATPATVNAFAGTGYLFNSQRPIARAVSAMVSRLMKALLSRARSRVILQNAEAGDSMVASGMVSRDRLVIIRGSGVDLAEYTPSPEPAGTPVVVLASRMLWDKGVREFVQAARILRAQSVRVRMALVGAPDPANPSAIATSELESWRDEGIVEWWGHRRDMPSVFAACHIVCLPSYHDTPLLAVLPLAIAGACIGFLIFNFSPASIFMGDAGSLLLGASLAGLGATYSSMKLDGGIESILIPLVLVVVPMVDTALVMSTRLLARKPVTVGGRDHVTHRLAFIGLKDWQVALSIYSVAGAASLLAVDLASGFNPATAVITILLLLSVLVVARYLAKLPIHPIPAPSPVSLLSMLVDELLYSLRILDAMVDLVVFAAAYWAAYLLRWGGSPPPAQSTVLVTTLALVAAVRLASFYAVGIYRGVWHQVSVRDVHRLLRAVLIGTLTNFAIIVGFLHHTEVGASVFLIDGMLVLLVTFGMRLSYRSLDVVRNHLARPGLPTVIFGVGKGGELTLRELSANRQYGLTPVGFLDDDPRKKGKIVFGLPVFGGRDAIAALAESRKIERMVIGSQMLGNDAIRELQRYCDSAGVELLQLRFQLTAIESGNVSVQRKVAGMNMRPGYPLAAVTTKDKRESRSSAAIEG